MASLNDTTIFLTGATRGIGRALALALAREKARLALCGRDREALSRVAEEVESAAGADAFSAAGDLSEEAEALGFYMDAREALGRPDVLINNAGCNTRKAPIGDLKTEEFDYLLAVNLRAPFLLMREAFHDMKARGSGHVVNILSTVCHFDMETMGAYTAAKSGLQALTRVYRKEARPHNIRVSAVYPGGVNTTFRPSPRPDYLKPESVAQAVVALLTLPEDLIVHDLTFRPMVETNF